MIDDQDIEEIILVVDDVNYFSIQPLESIIVPLNQNQSLVQNVECSNVSKYQAFP